MRFEKTKLHKMKANSKISHKYDCYATAFK